MKRLKCILLLIIPVLITFSGCTSDSAEVDDQVYTLVLGADKGIDNKIRLTVQYPTYKGGGGGSEKKGGGGESDKEKGLVSGTIVTTVEAPSLLEAINLMNTATARRISMVHTKAIIFSEQFAREGIENYLEPIARFRESRRIMQVIVCKGTAEDFIKSNEALIGESVAKSMELMFKQYENNGFFPLTPFHKFYSDSLSPYGQAYTIYAGVNDFKNLKQGENTGNSPFILESGIEPGKLPRSGDSKVEYLGSAAFNGGQMVGSLNCYETRYFQMVTGDFKRGTITIEDKNSPGTAIPLDVRLGRAPRIKTHFENDTPVVDVVLKIEADLGAIQSRIEYERLDRIEELNSQIETVILKGVKKTIERTQKEIGSDIFGFGRYIARHFATIQEFEQYNWLAHYREAIVNVRVDANVRRTGLMIGSSPIRGSDYKYKKE